MPNNAVKKSMSKEALNKAAKKAVARAMIEEPVKKINELGKNPNNVFRFGRKIKIESIDDAGGRCMRGNDGTLYPKEKHRA